LIKYYKIKGVVFSLEKYYKKVIKVLIGHLPEHSITVVAQVADVSSEVSRWLEKVIDSV
jgi:hypothetical protein